MALMRNTVLLLKTEKTDDSYDKYKELLKQSGFEVIVVKTLTFQFRNINILQEKLLSADKYSGIILSSPRCVNAANQALSKEKIQELWGTKANFTVGETTYDEAEVQLGIACRGKESGNAMNLSQLIIKEKANFTKPFLFPHGNLKTDTLKLELGRENLDIEGILVYDTLQNPQIGEDLSQCTHGFTKIPEFLVFFSPSGLHSSIKYLRKIPIDLSLVKIIAIGPVTELAIQEEGLKVHGVAKQPTPKEVLKAIM